MNDDVGPYLIAALVCERVLHETDGVTSIVRIVDSIQVAVSRSADTTGPLHAPLSLFIAIRGGGARGTFGLHIKLVDPEGNVVKHPHGGPQGTVTLTDGQPNVNVTAVLAAPFPGAGSYMLAIYLGETFLGKTPITLTAVVQERPEQKTEL